MSDRSYNNIMKAESLTLGMYVRLLTKIFIQVDEYMIAYF